MRVVEHARAKINLALHVTQRRRDGYHELDSIVAFADVGDVLTIEPAGKLSLTLSGPFAKDLSGESDNSVLAAWHALAEIADIKPVNFHLEKNLPIASGIGGGSADAAASIRGLIKFFGVVIEPRELNRIALKLGADVPVCLTSTTCRMRGIGEIIEPYGTRLPNAVVLVNPLLPCPTANVFTALALTPGQAFGKPIENLGDINAWHNDLTAPAIKTLPEIADVLASLQSQPSITTTRMSGSGATCFGLCETAAQAEAAAAVIGKNKPNWWVVAAKLVQ
jgi:4-diphosphocytidyl-2-C-methyl-D-erythritol kinase